MKLLIDFSKKFVFVVGVVGLIGVLIISLQARRVEASRAEFLSSQKQLELYRAEIWHIQKVDRQNLETRLVSQLSKFTNANEIPIILDELFKLGSESDVQIESAVPKNLSDEQKVVIQDVDLFRKVQIDIKIQAGYSQFSDFLSKINRFPKGVLAVDSFSIANAGNAQGLLSVNMLVNVFIKKTADQNILDINPTSRSESVAAKSRSVKIVRNPFAESGTAESNDFNIEGIIYDPVTPMILINGDVRKEGDVVNGMKIVKILENSVQLDKNGKKIVKNLKET